MHAHIACHTLCVPCPSYAATVAACFSPDGFLAPGQDVKLEVSFHPTAVNPDIRLEQLRCKLSGSAAVAAAAADASAAAGPATVSLQKLPDLLLTLTGACAATEATGEPVLFKCMVRSSTSKSIKLENPTSSNWQLRPVISNEFWSGAEFLQVPAGSSAEYGLLYKPLTMTPAEGQPHQGTVFFPLPDGSGLLYNLHGQVGTCTVGDICIGLAFMDVKHSIYMWLRSRQGTTAVAAKLFTVDVDTNSRGVGGVCRPTSLRLRV